MKKALTVVCFFLAVLPLVAQEGVTEETIDISGVGFVLKDLADDGIEVQPLMLKITARVQSRSADDDSVAIVNWQIDMAAMRYGFTTYFFDVLELDFTNFRAYIQPVSVNEYNQTVLGDRIGELTLKLSKISGLPGGKGKLRFEGNSYEVYFYETEVTNTFTRWVEMLE